MVSKIANLTNMNYTLEYFHPRVKAEIESRPDDLLADFARMVELLMDFGLQEENARNSGTSLADGPEKNEGGPKWIR